MVRASRAPLSIDAALAAPANDNASDGAGAKGPVADSSAIQVTCDLPAELGILPGEAKLIARFLDRLMMAANDNGERL